MTVDIDTRLREAGASLQRASFGLTPPEPRRRRPMALAVAVAAAVVVLVAGAAAVLRDDEDASLDVSTDPGGIPALVPEVVPPGLARVGTDDLPVAGGGPPPVSLTVYGDPGAADPFATADLGVVVSDSGGVTEGDPVAVRGTEGRLSSLDSLGTSLSWEESGVTVSLGSYSLTGPQLVSVAEALTVDGPTWTLAPDAVPSELPGRLAPVGSIADLSLAALPVPGGAPGHVVAYQAEDGGDSLLAATVAGDAGDLAALRWASGVGTPVEVRGHAGWLGRTDEQAGALGESLTLLWEEAPGVTAIVRGYGVSEADLLAAAESLRPVPAAEWRAALDEPEAGPVPADALVALEGQYAGGIWAVYVTGDGRLCGVTESEDEGSEGCGPADPSGPSVTTLHDNAGEAVLAYGEMPAGATGVRSRAVDGTESDQGASVADGDRRVWAVVVDPAAMPAGFAFVDGAGAEVAFLPLDP